MCMHLYVCLYVHVCACVCTHVGEGSLTLEDRTWRGGWGSRRERMEPWEKLEYSGVLWVEVSLLKGVPGKGGWGLASSRPSFRASAVCWGPSPAITSFPENGCARHLSPAKLSGSSQPGGAPWLSASFLRVGLGIQDARPRGGAGEGLLGRSSRPALRPVPKGPGSCAHSASTFVLPFAVYGALSSSFICSQPPHSLQRGLGGPALRSWTLTQGQRREGG